MQNTAITVVASCVCRTTAASLGDIGQIIVVGPGGT